MLFLKLLLLFLGSKLCFFNLYYIIYNIYIYILLLLFEFYFYNVHTFYLFIDIYKFYYIIYNIYIIFF